MPHAKDFADACRAMVEPVQRCMKTSYRAAHSVPCDAALLRIDPPLRTKIDALFLEAPSGGR